MLHTPARRLLAGLAVAGAVIGTGSAPAIAAPKAADIGFYLADLTVPVGETGAVFDPLFWADGEVVVEHPTVTYELSGKLTGVRLAPGDPELDHCESVSPTKLTCSDFFPLEIGPDVFSASFAGTAIADKTAEPGATGTVKATLSGTDFDSLTTEFTVRVAEAVDLTAGAPGTMSAAPGAAFDTRYSVRNTGDKPIAGAAALFFNDWAFEPAEQYSNCFYSDGELRSCVFDQTLAPGVGYDASMAYELRGDTRAPSSAYGEVRWMTPAELEDFQKYLADFEVDNGTRGTGGELTLKEAASQSARRAPQADKNPDDNWSGIEVEVTGKNGVDLAAVGSVVKGKAGHDVKATAGIRNVGKATLDRSRSGSPAGVTAVYAPAGTRFKSLPEVCFPVEGNAKKVECFTDYIFKAGQSETYEFVLHVDKVVANAKGVVAVNEPCECDTFQGDINKANNKAAIVVNKPAAAGTGGSGGGTGKKDASLPITGPAGAPLAIGGSLLVVLGAAAVFFTRRRRTPAES